MKFSLRRRVNVVSRQQFLYQCRVATSRLSLHCVQREVTVLAFEHSGDDATCKRLKHGQTPAQVVVQADFRAHSWQLV